MIIPGIGQLPTHQWEVVFNSFYFFIADGKVFGIVLKCCCFIGKALLCCCHAEKTGEHGTAAFASEV